MKKNKKIKIQAEENIEPTKEEVKKEDSLSDEKTQNKVLHKKSRWQRKREEYLKSINEDEKLNEKDKELLIKSSKIRYKPPLSYRSIKIFGLFFFLLPLIVIRIMLDVPAVTEGFVDGITYVADAISSPLIILAGYIIILKRKNRASSMLLIYLIMAIFIYLVTIIVFERYLITLVSALHPTWSGDEIRNYTNEMVLSSGAKSIVNYNIFLDLTLCCAFYFFTNITPKKATGKKLVLFRLCALIPAIYLIVSVILAGLFNMGMIKLNVAEVALLTCRAPATYLVFFGLSIYLAINKKIYKSKGVSDYGYAKYKETNAHSLQFSIVCSIIIAVVSLIDFIFSFFGFSGAFNFGETYMMCLIIPFVMLISYKKEYSSATVDFLIPVVYIALIALLIFEIIFQMLISSFGA